MTNANPDGTPQQNPHLLPSLELSLQNTSQSNFFSMLDPEMELLNGPSTHSGPDMCVDNPFDDFLFDFYDNDMPPPQFAPQCVNQDNTAPTDATSSKALSQFSFSSPSLTPPTSLRRASHGPQSRSHPLSRRTGPGQRSLGSDCSTCISLSLSTIRSLTVPTPSHHCILTDRNIEPGEKQHQQQEQEQTTRTMGDTLMANREAMTAVSSIIRCPLLCVETHPPVTLAVIVICHKLIAWNKAALLTGTPSSCGSGLDAMDSENASDSSRRNDASHQQIRQCGQTQRPTLPPRVPSSGQHQQPKETNELHSPQQEITERVESQEVRIGAFAVREEAGLASRVRAVAVSGELQLLEKPIKQVIEIAKRAGGLNGGPNSGSWGILAGSLCRQFYDLMAETISRT